MDEGELKLILLDLYRKAYLQVDFMMTNGPSVSALVRSLSEVVPRFAESYRRHLDAVKKESETEIVQSLSKLDPSFSRTYSEHLAAAKKRPASEQRSLLLDFLAQEIEELERLWGTPSK